jgi:hypothetical protein
MEIGVDSFAAVVGDEGNQAQSPQARLAGCVGLRLFASA